MVHKLSTNISPTYSLHGGGGPRAFVGFGGSFGVEDFAKQIGNLSENVFSSAALTGNLDADREAIRQALLKIDMATTVFGKVKFGNWTGPLGDNYTNQNICSPDHSVLAQWRGGKLLNVWQKANTETDYIFPDPTTK